VSDRKPAQDGYQPKPIPIEQGDKPPTVGPGIKSPKK